VIDTNLSSVFYTCRAVTRPMMKKRSGSIVNISSVVGVHGNWGQTNYAASKAGIIGFTKSLARELGSRNVRANVVAPGYVKTALTDVLPEEATQAMIQNTPPNRTTKTPGSPINGQLLVHPGDQFSWECEVDNKTDGTLTFSDKAYTGEMCNVFGMYAATTASKAWNCFF